MARGRASSGWIERSISYHGFPSRLLDSREITCLLKLNSAEMLVLTCDCPIRETALSERDFSLPGQLPRTGASSTGRCTEINKIAESFLREYRMRCLPGFGAGGALS